jgi:hypothetical protein
VRVFGAIATSFGLKGKLLYLTHAPSAVSPALLLLCLLREPRTQYNRGVWGRLAESRAQRIFPILRDWVTAAPPPSVGETAAGNNDESGRHAGQCYFKSTAAGGSSLGGDYFREELRKVRPHAYRAGCKYLDWAYLTEPFAALDWDGANWDPHAERHSVYVDSVR